MSASEAAVQNGLELYGTTGRSPWLDVDWRTHQRWVIVDGQPVNVIELGEGEPVVFVHGLSGSWQNWLEQLPVFAERHRVIAMDLPGFGYSPMPARKITIADYARMLDGLLDALDVEAAAVIGHSMGGFIAAEFAIAFPQRLERLVLASPSGLSSYRDSTATRALAVLRALEWVIAPVTAWGAANAEAITRRRAFREAILREIVRHPGRLSASLAAELVRGGGKPGFIDALEANLTYELRGRLPEISCPTLILWGERDHVVTVHDADVFSELIPDSRKVVFADTGHMPQIERPAAFNRLVEEFLGE